MNVYIHIYLEDYFVKLLMLAVLPSDKREDLLGTRRLRTASMSSGKCTVLKKIIHSHGPEQPNFGPLSSSGREPQPCKLFRLETETFQALHFIFSTQSYAKFILSERKVTSSGDGISLHG